MIIKFKWLVFSLFLMITFLPVQGNSLNKTQNLSYNTIAETKIDTPDFKMTGYANVEGDGLVTTTGGEGGTSDTVSSLEALQAYAKNREKNTSPGILYIRGKIESPESLVISIKHGANISVIGLGRDAELFNVGLNIWDYVNVIVRNLTIHEVLYPNDAITVDECHHVWIDHCELYSKIGEGIGVDTYDGLLDIKNGSRYVTVSWNYLHDHMKCSLIGHSDDASHEATDLQLRITFHHNYFQNTDGRNPSLRFGAIHMYNNYLENIADYGVAVRQAAHAKIEYNHFNSVSIPVTTNKFDGPEGFVCMSGNIYSGTCTEADNSITQTDCDFWNDLPYAYEPDSADKVAMLVQLYAGAGILDTVKAADPDTIEIPVNISKVSTSRSDLAFTASTPWPNPAGETFNFDINSPENGTLEIIITDISGREIRILPPLMLHPGVNRIQLNRDGLDQGICFYIFKYQNQTLIRKVSFM